MRKKKGFKKQDKGRVESRVGTKLSEKTNKKQRAHSEEQMDNPAKPQDRKQASAAEAGG